MPLLAAVWVLLVLFTLAMAIRQSPAGPRSFTDVLGRLGAMVFGVVGAIGLLAAVAGTGWVLIADIRNGPDQLCWMDWNGQCEEANEERRRVRAEQDCAGRWEDAAEEWVGQPRRALDGTPVPHDEAADRQAYITVCLRDR